MLGIFMKDSTKDATEYLFEYKTQRSKLGETLKRAITRIMAVVSWLVFFQMVRVTLPVAISQAPVCGNLMGVMMLIPPLILLTILIYNPDLLISDDTPLIVRASQEIVFVRHYRRITTSAIISREHIPIGQIKNAYVKPYSEDEYYDLNMRINGDLEDYETRVMRRLFDDGSSKGTIGVHCCAVLEVVDGRTFFIEFEGAKEFVLLVNKLRANIS